jgi:hypothetical protein
MEGPGRVPVEDPKNVSMCKQLLTFAGHYVGEPT